MCGAIPLIQGLRIALLNLLGTSIGLLSEYIVFGYILRAQNAFSISQQKRLSKSSMRIHVSGAPSSLWGTNNFNFLEIGSRYLYCWRDEKNQFKILLEMGFVQHAQAKSVFTFQLAKLPVSTTVKSAKPALTC